MEKFISLENFQDNNDYKLMPFRFSNFKSDYLISNDFGEWMVISRKNLEDLINKKLDTTSIFYRE